MPPTDLQICVAVLTVLATAVSPFLAIFANEWLRKRQELKERKTKLFQNLMMTRGYPLSNVHVEALNMIDIVFRNVRSVEEAWHVYRHQLSISLDGFTEAQHQSQRTESVRLLIALLQTMGREVGYDFSEDTIRFNAYVPMAHTSVEDQQRRMLSGLADVVTAGRPINVRLVDPGSPPPS